MAWLAQHGFSLASFSVAQLGWHILSWHSSGLARFSLVQHGTARGL